MLNKLKKFTDVVANKIEIRGFITPEPTGSFIELRLISLVMLNDVFTSSVK